MTMYSDPLFYQPGELLDAMSEDEERMNLGIKKAENILSEHTTPDSRTILHEQIETLLTKYAEETDYRRQPSSYVSVYHVTHWHKVRERSPLDIPTNDVDIMVNHLIQLDQYVPMEELLAHISPARELSVCITLALLVVYAADENDIAGLNNAIDALDLALITLVSNHTKRGLSHSQGSSRGGKIAAKQKKDAVLEKHNGIVEKAKGLLENGTSRREICGIIANTIDLSSTQIRMILKNNGWEFSKQSL